MLTIPKSKINNFIKTPSNGDITNVTHSLSPLRKKEERDNNEISYFQTFGEKENDLKNYFSFDKENNILNSFCRFRVTHKDTAEINDICISYDGNNYNFFINEDIKLLTKEFKKFKGVAYSSFAEIYEENLEIPKELKFLLTKTEVIKELALAYDNFKTLNEKIIENTKEVINKEDKKDISIPKENKNNKVEFEKENDYSQNSNIVEKVVYVQTPIPNMPLQNQNINHEQLAKINAFKKKLGLKLLQEKEDNKRLNFRTIKYPLPTNPLEKAIFLNGGTKPILCYGQQGSGKSFTAENYAKRIEKELGIPVSFYSILLEKNLDKADIVGSPVLKDDAFNYQKMAEAFMSARDGNLTIFLVDEIFRLKEMGTFFNLFGETHYKLDTGRQLEVVELAVEDIDGELQTLHVCLSDRKILNPNLILDNGRVQYLKSADDELFKRVPEQKIKDRLALGEIPIIERNDYIKYNLDVLKVSSFYTSEQIKAPIDKLIIIAAGNVGSEYQAHFKLDTDKAFRSRFAICEQPAPELKDYLLVFEQKLQSSYKDGYIQWDKNKYDIEQEIKNTTKQVSKIFEELFKLIKQGSFSSSSNFSHRNFVELADNLCKYQNIDSNTIRECFEAQEKAVLEYVEGKNSRVPTKGDIQAYNEILNVVLGGAKKKEVKAKVEKNEEVEVIHGISR